jgi:polysaccharide biosynthesis PFTS motif protein
MMRGYRILRSSSRLDLHVNLKEEITNLVLLTSPNYPKHFFFGAAHTVAELSIKQFLLQRLMGIDFNKELLRALTRPDLEFHHPLPPEWRTVVEKYGFKVNTFSNRIYWFGYKLLFLSYGFVTVASILLTSLKSVFTAPNKIQVNSAYFHGLNSKNLPNSTIEEESHDIISWYSKWINRTPGLKAILHSVSDSQEVQLAGVIVKYVPFAVSPLNKIKQIFQLILWSLQSFIICLKDLLSSRYWHVILWGEAARSIQTRLQPANALCNDYLFHNSWYLYRPLWTFEAEKKGSRILFYFYSTNCESFKTKEGYPIQANSWQLMTWTNFLVWDTFQADFIRRAVGSRGNIFTVGPIWFQSDNKEVPYLPVNNIAVFDIQPHRDSRYQSLGLENDFFTPETMNMFLHDVYNVANANNFTMVLKRKRNIGKLVNSKYQILINKLENLPNFVTIDSDISAFRLIEKTSVIISIPFTSTAIIAKEMGKVSIYYDPTGEIQKDDRAAHGIPVISGISELANWFHDYYALHEKSFK